MSISLIAPYRYPIRQPHAGGLEAMVDLQVRGLRQRGHQVHLFAAAGSEGHEKHLEFSGLLSDPDGTFGDVGYPPGGREQETAEFHRVLDELVGRDMDVVLNHSLHPAPLQRAAELPAPLVTTVHCPAFPEMAAPLRDLGAAAGEVIAVSRCVLESWDPPHGGTVVHNGVDTQVWNPTARAEGFGDSVRPVAVWVGRMVANKAPHLAVEAARRAGCDLILVGRPADAHYVTTVLQPAIARARATGLAVTCAGSLSSSAVARLVATASVALATPVWDEPFGLTAVEALCCGTPLVAFDRGGIGEVVRGHPGVHLVTPPAEATDAQRVRELAAMLDLVVSGDTRVDRTTIATNALAHFSCDRHLDRLEYVLRRAASRAPAVAAS